MILEALEREGVEYIFGYPGGANLPIYQHLHEHAKLKDILVWHEQGAAHMADGYARACGKPGVVFATSGPGALNLVTGLCTAYMDSVEMIAITGQVVSTQVGRDAFQESDVIGATSSVTKHSYLVTSIDQLPRVIHEAFHIATTGRPGPVLIDICKDVQMAEADPRPRERLDIPGYQLNGHVDLVTARLADFAPKVETFIHVDIDGSEMGKNVRPHIELVADARNALEAMLPHIDSVDEGRGLWLAQIDAWREEHPLRFTHSNG